MPLWAPIHAVDAFPLMREHSREVLQRPEEPPLVIHLHKLQSPQWTHAGDRGRDKGTQAKRREAAMPHRKREETPGRQTGNLSYIRDIFSFVKNTLCYIIPAPRTIDNYLDLLSAIYLHNSCKIMQITDFKYQHMQTLIWSFYYFYFYIFVIIPFIFHPSMFVYMLKKSRMCINSSCSARSATYLKQASDLCFLYMVPDNMSK